MSTIVYLSDKNPGQYLEQTQQKLKIDIVPVLTDTDRQGIFNALCCIEDETSVGEIDGLIIDADLTFKNNIDPAGGIELFQHLRFAPVDGPLRDELENDPNETKLERLTRLPVVLLCSADPITYLSPSAPHENLILLSPGCVLLSSTDSAKIAREYRKLQRFENREEFRKALLPYVTFNDGGSGYTNHGFLNKAGVGRFLHEFAGHALTKDDPIRQGIADVEDKLWVKKMRFKEPGLEWGAACNWDSEEVNNLLELCVDKHIVYIDDQHREGWAYGLYAGLFAQRTEDLTLIATELMRKDKLVEVRKPHKCLSVIDDNNVAETYLEDFLTHSFPAAMSKWSDSSGQEVQEAERELREAYENLPDLVFLDLRLSHEDENQPPEAITGMQRLVALKEKFPLLPVIVFTAATKKVTADLAQKAQAEALWIKGVSSGAELRAMTQKALAHSREWKELWLLNEMIKHKKEVLEHTFSETEEKLVPQFMEEAAKDQIHDLLDISISLLHHAIQNNSASHYKYVILNMGIIQETIFSGYDKARNYSSRLAQRAHRIFPYDTIDSKEEKRNLQKAFAKVKLTEIGFSEDQQNLRQLRNATAHSVAEGILLVPVLDRELQIAWQEETPTPELFSGTNNYETLCRASFAAFKFTLDTLLKQ